jgi:aryl-alcohol dehydrogenase-like predicted oxidoreductase
MRYRSMGRTGLCVSTVSFGGNRLGDPGVDPTLWAPIVQRALDLGVTCFDTSLSYNHGLSESVIGQVTSRHPEPTVVVTKVGFPLSFDYGVPATLDFSAAAILRDVDGQRARLQRDTIDVYLLHSPTVEDLEHGDWAQAITALKAQGKVRSFGISTSDHASGIWAIDHGADVLQIEYDLLSPSAEDELLPLAERNQVGIMVRTPLARGLLTGKFRAGEPIPPQQQWRRPSGDQLQLRLRRVEQLRFLERPGQTLTEAALRFPLAHPAVHCIIPGARTLAQLEANLAADDGALTTEELARIGQLHAEWRTQDVW